MHLENKQNSKTFLKEKEMKRISVDDVQYERFQGGRFIHYGSLVVEDDLTIDVNLVIDGDLIVAGDLEARNLYVTGRVEVGGDFVAADVTADSIKVGGNINVENLILQSNTLRIGGDFKVAGAARAATGDLAIESL